MGNCSCINSDLQKGEMSFDPQRIKEISKKLNLSTHTVYTHRKNIMEKLKLRRSSELVLYAVNKGLLL